MERQEVREKFRVDIRRKQITQKMEALRSKLHSEADVNYSFYLQHVEHILNGTKNIRDCLKELKILSFNSEGAHKLLQTEIHIRICSFLENENESISTAEYSDILTIMINLIVHTDIELRPSVLKIVVSSISIQERQIISLWMISNIIYQGTNYSKMAAEELVKTCDAIEFMEKRITEKFQNEGDIVIFNFFCCSFLTASGNFTPIEVKKIFIVIENILKFKPTEEENFWFLSEALIEHAQYIENSEYEIFGTEIIKKFDFYCKNKKTKFIKNYLKMLAKFTETDKNAYEKMLKYEMFKNLDFCIENRFPEVKKLCAEIGINLLTNFPEKIDIENISFFSQLVLEIINIEKYPLDCQISIIKYSNKFLSISLSMKITKESKEKFIDDLLLGSTLTVLAIVMLNSNNQIELISEIMSLLTIFLKIDESNKVYNKCISEKIPEFLKQLDTENHHFQAQINQFLYNLK